MRCQDISFPFGSNHALCAHRDCILNMHASLEGEREKRRTEKTCQGNLSETLPLSLPYLFLFHRWTWSVTQKCPSHLKAVQQTWGSRRGECIHAGWRRRNPPSFIESESLRSSLLKWVKKSLIHCGWASHLFVVEFLQVSSRMP